MQLVGSIYIVAAAAGNLFIKLRFKNIQYYVGNMKKELTGFCESWPP